MTQKTDITDLLHSIGIRLGKEALRAIVDDMHKRKLSPTQVFELLVDAETNWRVGRLVDLEVLRVGDADQLGW